MCRLSGVAEYAYSPQCASCVISRTVSHTQGQTGSFISVLKRATYLMNIREPTLSPEASFYYVKLSFWAAENSATFQCTNLRASTIV